MKLQLLTILCVVICLANCIRVSERLLKYKSGPARCRIAFSGDLLVPGPWKRFVYISIRAFERAIRHLNCTYSTQPFKFYKVPEEGKNYTGYVGLIQQDKADIANFGIRPDTLPYEPGKLTPVIAATGGRIITGKHKSDPLVYDLTRFLDLGTVVYFYGFAALLFVVPVLFTYSEANWDSNSPITAQLMLREYVACCGRTISLLIDQEQYSPRSPAAHILALAASLFTLFAIHGFLLNTVGSDLVAQIGPPSVDSLRDLLSTNLKPVILSDLYIAPVLKRSPEGTDQHEIWLRILRNKTHSMIDSSRGRANLGRFGRAASGIESNEDAIVIADVTTEPLQVASCLVSSDYQNKMLQGLAGKMYVSKGSFSEGFLTGLMSNQIHPFTEKVFSSILTTVLETGLLKGTRDTVTYWASTWYSAMATPIKFNSTTLMCLEGKSEGREEDFDSFPLHMMRQLFFFLLYASLSSFFVLLFEMCIARKTASIVPLEAVRHHKIFITVAHS